MFNIRIKLNNLLVCVSLLCLAGCAETGYLITKEHICPPAVLKPDSASSPRADAMAMAEDVLAGMHFAIEKLDVNAGYIRTEPLSGAQSFEFWRRDSVGSFNRAEADLQSIRRTVELNISDANMPGQVCINCIAITERLSMPQDLTASGQSRIAMSGGQKSIRKLGGELKPSATWVNLGRDRQLETEILSRIEKEIAAAGKEQK